MIGIYEVFMESQQSLLFLWLSKMISLKKILITCIMSKNISVLMAYDGTFCPERVHRTVLQISALGISHPDPKH